MGNSELFKKLEEKLRVTYPGKIVPIDSFLKDTNDIIEFKFVSEDGRQELHGLYSIMQNKVIYEPAICSDVMYHGHLDLISLYNCNENMNVWLDLNGKVILMDGQVIETFRNNCYLVNNLHYNNSSSVGYSIHELIKSEGSNAANDFSNRLLITGIVETVPESSGRYLMIKSESGHKLLIGVYDLDELKWICEPVNFHFPYLKN